MNNDVSHVNMYNLTELRKRKIEFDKLRVEATRDSVMVSLYIYFHEWIVGYRQLYEKIETKIIQGCRVECQSSNLNQYSITQSPEFRSLFLFFFSESLLSVSFLIQNQYQFEYNWMHSTT
jgi:hypothetical protein